VLNILDVIEAISGSRPDGSGQVISEAAIDSRQVLPGGLFIALPGERVDGHEYIADAFRRKANFALVQKDMSGSIKKILRLFRNLLFVFWFRIPLLPFSRLPNFGAGNWISALLR
jgi:UDP-N-acetylmuramyl pentapeptide synthase